MQGVQRARFNDGNALPGSGQRKGKGRSVQATARDKDITVKAHGSEYVGARGIVHARLRRYRPGE